MTRLTDLMEQAARMGITVQTDTEPAQGTDPDLMGWYDRRTHTIRLAYGLTGPQLLVTLQHELIHALHCLSGTPCLDSQKEEMRTRRETAQALISPHAYMIAEHIYDGDIWHIADDLGVTPSLVRDWQTLVLSA